MSDQQRLSRKLFKVLDDVGASETIRRTHQQSAVVMEILITLDLNGKHLSRSQEHILHHICGSRYEGSITPDLESDTDVIFYCLKFPVVLDPISTPCGTSLLMVNDDWSYPGYVKLQYVINGRPLTEHNIRRLDGTIFDVMGRLCINYIAVENVHGPARMELNEDGQHVQDTVFAFKCNNIPGNANGWIFRQRNHGWPTAEQIEAMSRMGGMVVRVGHWESHERDLEWRLSFSLQERLLMSSLNPVQHKAYIFLKMVKTNILGRIIECESLSSYHCKTCIFHAVEGTPAEFWSPDNLINCILYCLRLLLKWVRDVYCPNYFINDQNMFSKEGFMRVRDQIGYLLRKLVKMNHHFLYLLECDSIGSLMKDGDVQRIRSVTEARTFEFRLRLKQLVIYSYKKTFFIILHDSADIPYSLSELQSTDSINNYSKHETQTVITYLQPWLHQHIAKCLAARAIATEDTHLADMLLRCADEHFRFTSKTDVTSVRFAKASILYMYGTYGKCRKLLLEIERDLTPQVISFCSCRQRDFLQINDEHQDCDLTELMSQKPVDSLLEHHHANCVIFTRSESRITPTALQYEMYRSLETEPGSRVESKDFWFDFAVVDARVYLRFLQYLVYKALHMDINRNVALDYIKAQIEECNDYRARTGRCKLQHKDTAYNLLGWIYLQQNDIADALHCFTESLNIRPEHNAAKFHIKDIENQ